ncbi:YbjN domain-containing protein [Nostoc sp. FACHB-152]|uniref:YbjN domain-containing protein n=1 Tax=unclassified Nostoc TaxID=2593658 RepID=UPI001687FDDE|nr:MULTISPECIES: YbjN domain-containing protein [unclassified Nostoc]MBD2449263.1 YbjN domain-containing protein [Nostoc sp. FACHB-152]MBD2470459.1 YbjN domain-containing protein [Nostoc sp. FACHB-145]
MQGKLEIYQINSKLTFLYKISLPIIIHAIALSITKQNNELIDCRLTFKVNSQVYNRIETEELFSLKPDIRNFESVKFIPETEITIETSLKPDLLPLLAEHATNAEEPANYILKLSQEEPDHILLSTESWLALSVKQQKESGEVGYRTLWSYISPANLTQAANSGEEIAQGIINFFQDWSEANLSAKTKKSATRMLEGIDKFLTELNNINPEEISQQLEANLPPDSTDGNIYEEMINFFTSNEWPFVQLPGQSALQIGFQGENGKWNCYARAREEQQQFVFYSICPVNAPVEKRLAVAEFITRANAGMMVGNFELDFSDGEISYKTSIDVEGDRLTTALIQRLVYANVMMMDEYLPGILSVIYGNVSPEEAIAQIEP